MRICLVAGARPNFMKLASLTDAMARRSDLEAVVVHTGQHYDEAMSESFFRQLGLPVPTVNLEVGSAPHGVQLARIIERFEAWLLEARPDAVLVVGDVNSTVACGLVASRYAIPLVHVEAGLRSGDRTMPEEINRILTDSISDLLFVTEPSGLENLAREGAPAERCFLVGNTMIDTLLRHRSRARASTVVADLALTPRAYGVVTLHRPANVDVAERLLALVDALRRVARRLPLVFPVHPRTRSRLVAAGLDEASLAAEGLKLVTPLAYLEFLALQDSARLLMTDSGGIQEEAVVLGVPCLTLRENTERPVTIASGANELVGVDPERIVEAAERSLDRDMPRVTPPPTWDGKAGERIAEILATALPRLGRR